VKRSPTAGLNERFEQHLTIAASPGAVFGCFFAAEAIRAWWQATRSVTTPVPLGVYAVEWPTTPFRDDLLGPLGGVLHGTVVDVKPGERFVVGDCWWIPPEGDPIGPMGLQVTCAAEGAGCRLHVRQDGCEGSPRWLRYYAIVTRGWQVSLTALKRYAETLPRAPLRHPTDR
jgi:uncharacterized protein YndB with AHSA1/START domain